MGAVATRVPTLRIAYPLSQWMCPAVTRVGYLIG